MPSTLGSPSQVVLDMVQGGPSKLVARCVNSPSDFLAIALDEMAGNVVKSHFYMFWFSKGVS